MGQFIADLMARAEHTNRSLAAAAGVSESAVRNLLKFGVSKQAKDPDARTLSLVAKALDVDALRLFRLAGYIPPAPGAHSVRAEYLAETFDELPLEKQDAVLGVMEAMTDRGARKEAIQTMRAEPTSVLAGIEAVTPHLARLLANHLIAKYEIAETFQVDLIPSDAQVLQFRWGELPRETQERVKAFIRHKLSLDYDPTMVDPEWRT
ncbi:MAG: hypothetical protein IPK19_26965 [Chloroflexi bacterium]|nr:hypothetical protein [Chloroflexota bacterium]